MRVTGDVVKARLNNLEIFDNSFHGIQISEGVGLLGADLFIHDNGSANLAAFGGFLRCLDCRLENATFGGFTSRGVISIGGGSISGVSTGLFAVDGASIYVGAVSSPSGPAAIPVQASGTALRASMNSTVIYKEIATNSPVEFSGSLVVNANSFITLSNAFQQNIGTSFQFVGSSRLTAESTEIAGGLYCPSLRLKWHWQTGVAWQAS